MFKLRIRDRSIFLMLTLFCCAKTITFGWVVHLTIAPPSRRHHDNVVILAPLLASKESQGDLELARSRFRKKLQVRKRKNVRKPMGYWLDIENVEDELQKLWLSADVTLDPKQPPPIPNETLLNYWKRHDLRSAIVQNGGREELSVALGGSYIIPGKWSQAKTNSWVQQVIQNDPNLSADLPPLSPQQLCLKASPDSSGGLQTSETQRNPSERWAHTSDRKEKGYWSSEVIVIKELYEYLDRRRNTESIPAVYMPRRSELNNAGRNDLQQAIQRFGGMKKICRRAGLIPNREWAYIEGQYTLMLELKEYLDKYHAGDYTRFPIVSRMRKQGYELLRSLIQYYGGRAFVASKLGMTTSTGNSALNYGSFDLEFGINLLEFIRNDYMRINPPTRHSVIAMPSQLKLLKSGEQGVRLDEKMSEYGGYENVARRLGLAF